ncbi:MAG: hypothetical protein ACK5KT_12235 [Dysgonomonas sp.]
MKKIVFAILFTIMLFSACGSVRTTDITALNTGMTQTQVNSVLGRPVRILSTKYFQDGVEESYEYHTYYYEAYAVTFWNGRLSGYDFMYEVVPPAGIVPPNRPIPNRPNYPNRPSQPNRPNRPTEPNRPTQPSRPTEPTRPSRPDKPTELPSRPTTRPETKPENGSTGNTGGRPTYGQGSSRPTYTKQESSTTKQEETKEKKKE